MCVWRRGESGKKSFEGVELKEFGGRSIARSSETAQFEVCATGGRRSGRALRHSRISSAVRIDFSAPGK